MTDRARDLARLLAAAALEPALDGILLLDSSPAWFLAAADRYEELLRAAGGRAPRRVILGSRESEDDLWTRLAVRERPDGRRQLVPGPGHLVQGPDDPVIVLLVPDLTRLSFAARRAVAILLDAPVAHLQRHGADREWRPRVRCLAACPAAAIGQASRHLLERLPVRFAAGPGALGPDPVASVPMTAPPGATVAEAVRAATARAVPTVPGTIREQAVRGLPAVTPLRRALALLRLARGLARLEIPVPAGPGQLVAAEHVDEARRLLGLARAPAAEAGASGDSDPVSPPPGRATSGARRWQDLIDEFDARRAAGGEPGSGPGREAVGPPARDPAGTVAAYPGAALPGGTATLPGGPRDPYPEDRRWTVTAEFSYLTTQDQRVAGVFDLRGDPVGTRPATHLRDIAWTPTLIEAAKYQEARRRLRGGRAGPGLIVSPADLMSYQRIHGQRYLLVLVLDYTCLDRVNVAGVLASYLDWAAWRRAAVTVVEVGAAGPAGAGSPLRARSFAARNAHDAVASGALSEPRGGATPLAHGLDLARAALARNARGDRSAALDAWLVVVTDGLGNIPLAASRSGAVSYPLAGEGIADCLAVAAQLARLRSVHSVVIAPPRPPLPEMPARLAAALGAGLIRATPGERG
ncbi:MAG TPA: hypothetical protein VH478_07150 [Trebonia sp.]|nr:hypothetical protein [Trebonia sp.]